MRGAEGGSKSPGGPNGKEPPKHATGASIDQHGPRNNPCVMQPRNQVPATSITRLFAMLTERMVPDLAGDFPWVPISGRYLSKRANRGILKMNFARC